MQEIRTCEYCGQDFQINAKRDSKKRFCNTSCSAKWRMRQPEHLAKVHTPEIAKKRGLARSAWLKTPAAQKEIERIRNLNPMSNLDARRKCSETLKAIGHKPLVRGGNGHGMTAHQKMLKDVLHGNWIAEHSISLGKRQHGYPTNYKVDLANLEEKIAIEVDGNSHYSRKKLDKKKDEKLISLGWKVLRFWNKQIADWINSGMKQDHYISLELSANKIRFMV